MSRLTKNCFFFSIVLFSIISLSSISIFAQATTKKKNTYTYDAESISNFIFEYTNQTRAKYSLKPVTNHPSLQLASIRHGKNMIAHKFYAHIDHKNRTPSQRFILWFPTVIGVIGENLGYLKGYQDYTSQKIAAKLLESWMASPGHKKNILKPNWNYLGVGVLLVENKVYALQTFGDLIANLSSPYPQRIKENKKVKLKFDYLASFNPNKLRVYLQIPNKNKEIRIPDPKNNNKYFIYRGQVPLKVEWHKTYFSVNVPFLYGKGKYSIVMGHDKKVTPHGPEFIVE